MSEYKLKTEDWRMRLHRLQAINADLKNQLAGMLHLPLSKEALLQIEALQTQFVNKDAAISLFRNEISQKVNPFKTMSGENQTDLLYTPARQLLTETDIHKLEIDMEQLQQLFCNTITAP